MRRLWPLTVRGTGALILALACFVVAHEAGLIELLYFGVLLCAALVAGVVSLYLTRRTDAVTRTLSPDVCSVGGECEVTVRIGMRSALPTSPGRWHDAVSPGLRGAAGGDFPALGSGMRGDDRPLELSYRVSGEARGVHTLGPLSVAATDPFGLARRRYVLGRRSPVTVAPAILDLAPLPSFGGEAGGMLHTPTAQLGQGADNLVARPYAPGDSMRRIHWRATAHRDTLMVRQEEQESSPEATVVLDRGVLRWSGDALTAPGADPEFETAVSAVVSIVARLVHEGYTVEIIDSDGAPLAEPIDAGDATEVDALAAAFATVTARRGDHLPTVAALFGGVNTGPVIVVTGRLGTADADALAPLIHHSSLPVLLAASPSAGALDRLRGYGWRAAGAPGGADLQRVWDAALEREGHRVVG